MKHAAVSVGISIALTTKLGSHAVMLRAQDKPKVRTSDASGARQREAAATFAGVCASCHSLDAHYNLALALHQQRKEAESRAEFNKAYEISPELINAPRP